MWPWLIGGAVALFLYNKYKGNQESMGTLAGRNGTTVALPGITIPSNVTLTSRDVQVARGVLNTSAFYILSDGNIYGAEPVGGFPGHANSIGLPSNYTPAMRVQLLQRALNMMGNQPGVYTDLFSALWNAA